MSAQTIPCKGGFFGITHKCIAGNCWLTVCGMQNNKGGIYVQSAYPLVEHSIVMLSEQVSLLGSFIFHRNVTSNILYTC